MVCPPVRGDNPQALASGLSPVQAIILWNNYFIPPLKTLLIAKYLLLKLAFHGTDGLIQKKKKTRPRYISQLKDLGPVAQSIVSLTSLLRGPLIKCFTTL